MAAGARRRQLPAWMGAAGDERAAAAAPSPSAGRRRAAAGRRPAALYCMNEAELLEVALAVLAENLQSEEGEEKARSGSEEEQEIPPTPQEVPGSTGSTDGGSDRGPALPSPPAAGAEAEGTGGENSEDDVLKYVREIFFS
ncbi:cell cycle regulator of non-homologous end joining [Ammospiza nelsoni]|uniref:cell cycle regulator of non-homologous end joining n=1 Tax=Ammospiza caudacuta TaxID=2857398 RepID=UPI002739A5C1|nr:cell cycle regulator of non-homologous end joining [Ammospiza caudacuta]XP_059327587.1 cell cycle regulator of non-homologous end joining [Ammospiza nelsoni]